ncbi:protein NO VEIN domain-containing protein [Cellulosimicrobium cellulans]|uniref:protein NO VEIN domain-containing protein n=1 Tax=Cellulosimicrobium cellulans TaxID=1710 RepID=UPI0036E2BB2A
MVVIRGFVQVPAPARKRPRLTTARCDYDAFDDDVAGRVLELATTGSEERVSTGKRSQTIQLDRRAALTLLGLMEDVFGSEDLYSERTSSDPKSGVVDMPGSSGSPTIDLMWPMKDPIVLPSVLHGHLQPTEATEPQYIEKDDESLSTGESRKPTRPSAAVNRAIEVSAVELVKHAFQEAGWTFARDRQRDGTGYDLEFTKDGERRKVEVKGIQSERLEFNVTPYEFYRAQTDPEFVLVAVTGALDERKRHVRVVSREALVAAPRKVLGYRVRPEAADREAHAEMSDEAEEDSWH